MTVIMATLFGFLGGSARAIVGLLKIRKKIKKDFKIGRLLTTLILSSAIGAVVAWGIETNNLFYLAAGYAGTDILEGLNKARK